ncbi:uncharacterized protein LOC144562697 [Carex rostrata]
MDNKYPSKMTKPIELWVRILVLASLSIQIGLMFLAPLRKCSSNKVLVLTIWLFYLTAELVPPLALGNMGKKIDLAESGDSGTITSDLTILWASFLLLHLGDPNTITSYSTDDNELWWRLLLGLVVQVVDAVYAFGQSPPNPVLLIPTTLVCIAGMIKFVEKTHALRLGSRDNLKDKIMWEIRMKSMNRGSSNHMDKIIMEHGAVLAANRPRLPPKSVPQQNAQFAPSP